MVVPGITTSGVFVAGRKTPGALSWPSPRWRRRGPPCGCATTYGERTEKNLRHPPENVYFSSKSGVARNRSHAGIVCCCFVFCFVYFREADGKGCRVRGAMTTILESSFFLTRLVYDY